MSLNFTSLQKKAIVRLLFEIVNADEKITVGENDYFMQLQKNLEISDTDVKEASYMSITGSLSIVKQMSQEEKQVVAFIISEMIKSDTIVDDKELQMFSAIIQAADITLPESE